MNTNTRLQRICRVIGGAHADTSIFNPDVQSYEPLAEDLSWHKIESRFLHACRNNSNYKQSDSEFLEKIKVKTRNSQFHSLEQQRVTAQLSVWLDKIPFLIIKGASLSAILASPISIRQAKDIDLLIAPDKVQICIEKIISQGFQLIHPQDNKTHLASNHLKHEKDAVLIRPSKFGNIEIEIHWRLDKNKYAYTFNFWSLYQNSQPFNIGNQTLTTLGNSDYFHYVLMHGAFSSWGRLKWLIDLADLLRASHKLDIDWERVDKTITHAGHKRALQTANQLLIYYFDVTLPIKLGLSDTRVPLTVRLLTRICIRYHQLNRYPPKIVRALSRLLMVNNWSYRRELILRGLRLLFMKR